MGSHLRTMELSRLLLLLLPCLSYSQVKRVNRTRGGILGLRTPRFCLTTSGERCQFPFIFKGQTYSKCTYADSPTPWCATLVDQNYNAITNRWGDCSIADQDSSCEVRIPPGQSSCTTIGGPKANKPCVFPFRHGGVTYSSCTKATIDQLWCSTETRSDGSHIIGQYGLCSPTCKGTGGTSPSTGCPVTSGPAKGGQCVFPFSFNGNTYQGCTPWKYGTLKGKPWCSTRTDGQGNHLNGGGHYGFCGPSCPGYTEGEGLIKGRINTDRNDDDGIVFGDEFGPAPT